LFYFFFVMLSSKDSFLFFAFVGIVVVALAGELPIRSFRPPAIPFITQSPEVQNYIRDDVATGSEGVAWWDGSLKGMVGLVRVDGTIYRWLGIYNEDRDPSKHVVTFDETDVSPGSHDIANSPMSSMDDCNRFCSRYPTCRAFVLDEKLDICYLKDTVEPRTSVADHAVGIVVPDADKYPGKDVAPGSCDISNKVVSSDSECAELCAESADCKAYVLSAADKTCYLKSCADPVVASDDRTAYIPKELHPDPVVQPTAAKQVSVVVYPTRTVFEFEAGSVKFTVTTLSSLFADDFDLMARPTTTVYLEFVSLDGKLHDVSVYLEAESIHTVSNEDEDVEWDSMKSMTGVRMGSKKQDYFKIYGDHVGMDWGYLNLAAVADPDVSSVTASAGKAADLHKSFAAQGYLPGVQKGSSRARDGPIVAAVTATLNKVSSTKSGMRFIYGYDDVVSVYYFGDKLLPYWTQKFSSFDDVMKATVSDFNTVSKKSEQFDNDLLNKVAAKAGDKMATLIALAYRQTLAAIKPVWNDREKTSELYLREISTNSDLNTVDVVFPASPLFLYFNQDLLWKLLNPVLRYGNNETWIKYSSPYSPHQLGVYPVGNDTTEQQEQMPTENTGNMFLMLLAILQRNGGDTSFYYPRYFPLLKSWADTLLSRLPFIQNELCTDDFLGPIANNTNVAAKGIIALSAFSDLCKAATKDPSCDRYEQEAERLAKMWIKYGYVSDGVPHIALCFHNKDTWSTKYNLLWQKILNFTDRPFPNFRDLVDMEEKYYLSVVSNKYGFPVDSRTTAAKLDWISWAAALAYDDDTYNTIVDMFYNAMNDMETRCPMTDLYYTDSSSAAWTGSFVSRPVVGGLFAKMLV